MSSPTFNFYYGHKSVSFILVDDLHIVVLRCLISKGTVCLSLSRCLLLILEVLMLLALCLCIQI